MGPAGGDDSLPAQATGTDLSSEAVYAALPRTQAAGSEQRESRPGATAELATPGQGNIAGFNVT